MGEGLFCTVAEGNPELEVLPKGAMLIKENKLDCCSRTVSRTREDEVSLIEDEVPLGAQDL